MQSVLSISYEDNHYTKGTYIYKHLPFTSSHWVIDFNGMSIQLGLF